MFSVAAVRPTAWYSDDGQINDDTLRPARLLLGRVTFRGYKVLV